MDTQRKRRGRKKKIIFARFICCFSCSTNRSHVRSLHDTVNTLTTGSKLGLSNLLTSEHQCKVLFFPFKCWFTHTKSRVSKVTRPVLELLGVLTSPCIVYPTKRLQAWTYRLTIGAVHPEKLKSVRVLDSDVKAGQRNLIKLSLWGGFTSYVKISFVSTLVKLCACPEDKRVCGCLHLGGIRRGTQRRKRWKHVMFGSYFRRGR